MIFAIFLILIKMMVGDDKYWQETVCRILYDVKSPVFYTCSI